MKKIPCVFCFDRAFVEKAAVAIASLCVHAESDYKIYCLVSDAGEDDLSVLRKIARRFHVEIVFIYIDNQFTDWKTQGHISPATYFRLLIPSRVPELKVIYLDCDILVTCDLTDLFDVELGDALIAGCLDESGGKTTKIKVDKNDPYLNAGVLVLDLEQLRADDFFQKARLVYQAHESEIVWADQCLINKMMAGRKRLLDRQWNVMAHDRPSDMSLREWCEPFDRKGILHFSGAVKPWHPWASSWEAGLWQCYARAAGVAGSEATRKPATVTEWRAVAQKAAAEEKWQEAAAALKVLSEHYRHKALAPSPPQAKP